jgi:hypothetical protein
MYPGYMRNSLCLIIWFRADTIVYTHNCNSALPDSPSGVMTVFKRLSLHKARSSRMIRYRKKFLKHLVSFFFFTIKDDTSAEAMFSWILIMN